MTGMGERAKKFREYARRIECEAEKFKSRGSARVERATAPMPVSLDREGRAVLRAARLKKWTRLESASCERFVRKIVKLVEDFEID